MNVPHPFPDNSADRDQEKKNPNIDIKQEKKGSMLSSTKKKHVRVFFLT
jgi:hypothetical protein